MEFFLPLSGSFDNPLACKTLYECLVSVLNIVIYVLFPFIVLMIVYTGFLFVVAQGKPEKLSRAKSALVWVLIGALVILGSKALALAIEATVAELTV